MTETVNQTAAPAVTTDKVTDKKFEREELIQFYTDNVYNVLQYITMIEDDFLRGCHLRAKAIGDDLFFLTADFYRRKGLSRWKHNMSDFITPEARRLIESGEKLGGRLIFEHLVPKNIYIEKFKNVIGTKDLTKEFVYEIFDKYYYTCTVTVEEDELLDKISMPKDWDGIDVFYRYKKAGIIYEENLHNFKAKNIDIEDAEKFKK